MDALDEAADRPSSLQKERCEDKNQVPNYLAINQNRKIPVLFYGDKWVMEE